MGSLTTREIRFHQQVAEVEAEIKFRQTFYGVQVRAGKMREEVANEKLATMRAVLETLRELERYTIERFGFPGDGTAKHLAMPRKITQME